MRTDWINRLETEVLQILRQSPVPEDYAHALNVREWVNRLRPHADSALQIAAIAHDIERALPQQKVDRHRFANYDDFKRAHAANSARIMAEKMASLGVPEEVLQRVVYLIRHHEFGRDNDADLEALKDADSLSFFETNLPGYYHREGEQEALRRMRWGYKRLSKRGRKIFHQHKWQNKEVLHLLKKFNE